jgi:hypothetical protein
MADETSLRQFSMKIVDETKPTSDGRYFVPDTLSWREMPLSLMAIRSNDPAGGHKNSVAIGAIHDIWRDNGAIYGRGEFTDDATAAEYIPLVENGVLTGISADVVGAKKEIELAEDGGQTLERITGGEIAAVTLLPIPAFADTRVVIAAAIPVLPPKAWFEAPAKDTSPYALTVEDDGRVHGFAARWDTCHIGSPTACLTPPKSKTEYAYYRIGQIETAEGDKLSTGVVTMAKGHAKITLNARQATEHYDDTTAGVADVVTYELDNGIWFGGALRPTVTEERVRELAGSGISGDWRQVAGNLELVGLLAVNTPGFPVPRTTALVADASDEQFALVAAGIVTEDYAKKPCCADCAETDAKKVVEAAVEEDVSVEEAEDSTETAEANFVEATEEELSAQYARKVKVLKAKISLGVI